MWENKSLREAFGETLVELGRENPSITAVSADLEDSTRAEHFKKEFPNRFFTLGIAEQDMVGTAAGLALAGYLPFASSFAVFLTNQAYGAIRILLCYNNLNVKLVSTHAGLTVGEDGATAQSLEDIAIMRVLPNMRVIVPCDAVETRKAVRAAITFQGPCYIRLSRAEFPVITSDDTPFELGKALKLAEGSDLTIAACGVMVSKALKAAETLKKQGISARVLNFSSVKPIDEEAIIKAALETGAIVTAEEHQLAGGLGSAVAEVLSQNKPVPVEMVGVADSFGESGKPDELMEKYGLSETTIVQKALAVLKRK